MATDLASLILFGTAAFLLLALYGNSPGQNLVGEAGRQAVELLYHRSLGVGSYLLPLLLTLLPLALILERARTALTKYLAITALAIPYLSLWGGLTVRGGDWGNQVSEAMLAELGAFFPLLLILIGVALTVWATGRPLTSQALRLTSDALISLGQELRRLVGAAWRAVMGEDEEEQSAPTIATNYEGEEMAEAPDEELYPSHDLVSEGEGEEGEAPAEEKAAPETASVAAASSPLPHPEEEPRPEEELVFTEEEGGQLSFKPALTLADYQLPPLSLLAEAPRSRHDPGDLEHRAKVIERTLSHFKIDAQVVHIQEGPRVTRFEIKIGPGINVSRIVSLADNLALELAVKSVRIEAPIPGKSAIGIEVPNEKSRLITLRSILESPAMKRASHPLTVAIGRDIGGAPVVANLSKMPHLLIAGATGSGKSVLINAILMSLLMRCTPDELRLILIDPKMVEMTLYRDLPHLLAPVVNEVSEAQSALAWLLREMERRYRLFSALGAKDIQRYNQQVEQRERVPYIVVVIDELADLMMMAGPVIEKQVCRVAQKARAAGIHLVIATQRPDTRVITGTIKANIPSRIAFAVVSQVDSRTILDMGGAEKLLGSGDMLYYPVGYPKPIRVQGAFVSDQEIKQVTDFCKAQAAPVYQEAVLTELGEEVIDPDLDQELDPLFEEAKELVVREGRATTSFLQRRLGIGYNRAARIMEQLEAQGVVGPQEGNRPREILLE